MASDGQKQAILKFQRQNQTLWVQPHMADVPMNRLLQPVIDSGMIAAISAQRSALGFQRPRAFNVQHEFALTDRRLICAIQIRTKVQTNNTARVRTGNHASARHVAEYLKSTLQF